MTFFFVLLTAPIATGLGVWFRARDRSLRSAYWLLVVATVAWAILVASLRGPEVTDAAFVLGLLLGTLSLGVVPAALYFSLGRRIQRLSTLALVWAFTLPVLVIYGFYATLLTFDLVYCPVDAYECPV